MKMKSKVFGFDAERLNKDIGIAKWMFVFEFIFGSILLVLFYLIGDSFFVICGWIILFSSITTFVYYRFLCLFYLIKFGGIKK